jgi:diaminopimelate decarboxylase
MGLPGESKGVWAAAARSRGDLATDTSFAVRWNEHYHGDTCPAPPAKSRVTVGGQPGVLLAYGCGILINFVVTIHHGDEYWFVFVDRSVSAPTDSADSATFLAMLRSVRFVG